MEENKLSENMENEDKFKIWLVWDTDTIKFDRSLRAVTTTEERAKKYKTMIEKQHIQYNNQNRYKVEIEESDANHIYGFRSLKRLGENDFKQE